jgi:sphingosine kinase
VRTISGDGLLHEFINGLMSRSDGRGADLLETLSLGVVPAGSGNGLAHSLGLGDATTAALAAARGSARPMDLFRVTQGADVPPDPAIPTPYGPVRYGFLSVEWCVIADVDIDSEKYRWMGGARFTFTSVLKVFDKTAYQGRLVTYDASAEPSSTGISPSDPAFPPVARPGGSKGREPFCGHVEACRTCAVDAPARGGGGAGGGEDTTSGGSAAADSTSRGDEWSAPDAVDVDTAGRPPVVDEEGDFRFWIAMNTSHMSSDAVGAATAHVGDGLMDLTYARTCSKSEMLKILLAIEPGKHHQEKCMVHQRVPEFYLEPRDAHGKFVVDGERIPYSAIHVRVLPRIARVMCKPGPDL